MSEAMTVRDLIDQMEYAQHFIIALVAVAVLVYFITEMRLSRESHRIWKELRKLEKEKLEKELESLKNDD